MTAAPIRTASVPDAVVFRLILIALVAFCGGQGVPAQTVRSGDQRTRPNAPDGEVLASDLTFAHLTTADGLSKNNVVDILQDRRGFMWFATGDGLNRYDGNSFVVYKNDPNDPGSLSHNFIRDPGRRSRLPVGCRLSGRKQIRPQDRT